MTDQRPRSVRRAALDALGAVPLFAAAPFLRHWHLRWGATGPEVHGPMPGDDIVPRPSFQATRAITIDAPPESVWPWIVQVGYGRAAFYSYSLLDNAGYDSADRILPEWQDPRAGDRMPMASTISDTTAFTVTGLVANRWLLWSKPDSTWSWTLVPLDGDRTRLITRLKAVHRWAHPASALVSLILLEVGDFPMMRRMLRGIKARAERGTKAPGISGPTGQSDVGSPT